MKAKRFVWLLVCVSSLATPGLAQAQFLLGDVNGDGNVDNLDMTPFIAAQAAEDEAAFLALYPAGEYWAADCKTDGNIDNLDMTAFSNIVGGGQRAPAYGPVTVFLSPVTTIGGGAVLDNPVVNANVGDIITLGVWVTGPSGLTVNGLALDLVETAGILNADWNAPGYTDPNFAMAVQEAGAAFDRWNVIRPPALDVSSTELFVGSNAIGVSTLGLTGDPASRPSDGNYDPDVEDPNGAFLHAIITLKADALGTTDLFFQVGKKKIGYNPDTNPDINFGTGDAAISREIEYNQSALADATIIVPEPGTMLLLCGAAAILSAFRRKTRTGRRRCD